MNMLEAAAKLPEALALLKSIDKSLREINEKMTITADALKTISTDINKIV